MAVHAGEEVVWTAEQQTEKGVVRNQDSFWREAQEVLLKWEGGERRKQRLQSFDLSKWGCATYLGGED